MKKDTIIFILIIVWAITITFALATYKRTQIVDYDVKRDHMIMSHTYNYCPVCGTKLESEVEE